MDNEQDVLCIPRSRLDLLSRFTPWSHATPFIDIAEVEMRWIPRIQAETSDAWIQPIPCALVQGANAEYHVFRRIREGRHDLSGRISMVIGGHIDCSSREGGFLSLAAFTLVKELEEELKVRQMIAAHVPIGLVVDVSSRESSRHVGLVYEVVAEGGVKPKASEEFALGSRYAGKLSSLDELRRLYRHFDPWSMILFADYIRPSHAPLLGHQLNLWS